MAKKEVKITLKLQLHAGKASPTPIGPTLAPMGIDTKAFCQEFNERTKEDNGILTPVVLTIYEDRSFEFYTKTPPVSELIRRELGIDKGSDTPNTEKVGTLTQDQLAKIAEIKMPDLNTTDMEQAKKIIQGTAKQMGIEWEEK
jgi:large subunit ribosomal protein L11